MPTSVIAHRIKFWGFISAMGLLGGIMYFAIGLTRTVPLHPLGVVLPSIVPAIVCLIYYGVAGRRVDPATLVGDGDAIRKGSTAASLVIFIDIFLFGPVVWFLWLLSQWHTF